MQGVQHVQKSFILLIKYADLWRFCPRHRRKLSISGLQIGVQGHLRVQVFNTEHALLGSKGKIFEVRALRT